MTQDEEPLPCQEPIETCQKPIKKPWVRALRNAGVTLGVGLLSTMALPSIFPGSDPFKLGEEAGKFLFYVALFVFIISWLGYANHKIIALLVSGAVVAFAGFIVIGIQTDSRRAREIFTQSAQKKFTLIETESGNFLKHEGLGIAVASPGGDYTAPPVGMAKGSAFSWSFINAEKGKTLLVFAQHIHLSTAEDIKAFLRGFAQGAKEGLGENNDALHIISETAQWDHVGRNGILEFSLGEGEAFCCLRIIYVDDKSRGYDAVFAAQAFADDRETARTMAESLRIEPIQSGEPRQ